MLKIEVRAINDALCAIVEDYVWAEENMTELALNQLIYEAVDDWMFDYCEDEDDEEDLNETRVEIISISKE